MKEAIVIRQIPKRIRNGRAAMAAAALASLAAGCKTTVDVKPIEVKPIFVTIEIKRVDQQLDNFFDYENRPSVANPSTQPAAATMPQAAPISSSSTEAGAS